MEKKAQELLGRLESQLVELWGDEWEAPEGWESYPLVGLCYGERDGCVNEHSPLWNDESLEMSVINLFYECYKAVRDTVEEELGIGSISEGQDWIKIVVEPSYEDTSFIVIYLVNAKKVIFTADIKAWHYQFNTAEELADDLLYTYQQMLQNIN